MTTFLKDPEAVLDYLFNWGQWMASGDTIAVKTITASTGLTVNSSAIVAGTDRAGVSVPATGVQVWVSGGVNGVEYTLTCRIITVGGRIDDRTMIIRIQDSVP